MDDDCIPDTGDLIELMMFDREGDDDPTKNFEINVLTIIAQFVRNAGCCDDCVRKVEAFRDSAAGIVWEKWEEA